MADVFVSYARSDRPRVAPLVAAIEAQGWSVWWDPGMAPGQEFDRQIETELKRAVAVVVVWTPSSVGSRWVRGEAREAATRGVLVPVRFQDASLPIDVRALHTTDLDDWGEDPQSPPAQEMLRALGALIARERDRQSTGASPSLELAVAASAPAAQAAHHTVRARVAKDFAGKTRLWMSIAAALALATIGLLALHLRPQAPAAAADAVSFSVLPPDKSHFGTSLGSGSGVPVGGSISPDGRHLAFTVREPSGKVMLWVRSLRAVEARMLPDTDDAALPFWSPDSKAIGFFAQGKLQRIDIEGGRPQTLTEVHRGQGGTWGGDGVIVFGPDLRSGLFRVSASGGERTAVTTLAKGYRAHRFPYFLPDGRHFLYYAEGDRPQDSGVFVSALGAAEGKRVAVADSAAIYAHPDQLLFVRADTLFAQRFDTARIELIGTPVSLAQPISSEGSAPVFSVSHTGVLTYRPGPADSDQQQFVWFDRAGKQLAVVGEPGTYRGIDLSPDGTRIAVHNHVGTGGDIWVFEPRGTTTRVTFDPTQDNSSPIWSPDGRRIAFGSLRNGKWGLYQTDANGTGEETRLIESEIPKIPASWSPDGKLLVYWLYDPGGLRQWVLPLTGGEAKPFRMSPSRFYESHAQVSPNGKWVAYGSASGGRPEIYVRPFPSGEAVWQVSTSGGFAPRWRRDGRELFYMSSFDHAKIMAVGIETAHDTLTAGVPQELFDVDVAIVPHSTAVQNFHTFAVSPDGQRFLIPLPAYTLRGDTRVTPITVVLNWTALLQQQ